MKWVFSAFGYCWHCFKLKYFHPVEWRRLNSEE